ncbi:MAG: hypothetical protein V3U96_10335 [Paracoccaceae bacterium]
MSINAARAELSALLGQYFSQSKADLAAHAGSESHFSPIPPDGVAYPGSTDDLVAIVKICARYACPLIAWGVMGIMGHIKRAPDPQNIMNPGKTVQLTNIFF